MKTINSFLRSSSMPTLSWQRWEVGCGGDGKGATEAQSAFPHILN